MPSPIEMLEENIRTKNPVLDLTKTITTLEQTLELSSGRFKTLLNDCYHLEKLVIDYWYLYSDYEKGPIKMPDIFSVRALQGLKVLHLSNLEHFHFEHLDDIKKLNNLENLKITQNNNITNFAFISQLTGLKKLDLSNNTNLNINPIFSLSNLEELRLWNCNLTNLDNLQNLKKLKYLELSSNNIQFIEPIKELYNLEHLSLSSNPIQDIGALAGLKNLKTVYLSDLGLTNMEGISQLSLLEELVISRNKIEILDLPVGNLKLLEASGNNILTIRNAEYQNKLETVMLNNTQLTDLSILTSFINLRQLSLSKNKLSSIQDLTTFVHLEELDISHNNISEIDCLEKLPKLRNLCIGGNKIKVLSAKIFNKCFLHGTTITSDDLRYIKNAVVRQQNFEEAANLRDIEKLLVAGKPVSNENIAAYHQSLITSLILPNPFELPDLDTLRQGTEAIKAFYENLIVSELIPFREAKVILLGEPDAGKSSLLNYFLGAPFVEEKSVTRGVRIARYNFTEGSNDYRINFWDFGGQEVQQALHQYFLTDNTLYLIILNAVTDEQPDKYLQFLDNHAPNSPFFIITNKDDLNERSKLKNNQIASTYESRWKGPEYRISVKQASLLSSCNNDQLQCNRRKNKLQELFFEIKKTFLQLPHLEQGFLSNYKNVKQVVEELYEKEKKPYITMQEFDTFCKAQGIAEGTEIGLLSQLNFIGTVRYVDETNLSGIHILNPEWLSDGMYRIITDGGIKNEMMGKIQKKDIIRILQPQNKTDYKYKDNEIDYLVTLMCHFRVAYQDEYSKFIYLPDAFPDDLPQTLDKASFTTVANHYYFSYDTEIPSYIIIRFIVKMFKYVKDNQYWNRGIVLQHHELPSNPWEALIEQNDRRIDIWLKGKDFQSFFTLIRDALRYAHEERFKAWKEMIDLGDFQVSYHDILSYLYDGDTEFKSTVIDQKTGKLKKYNINEVLGRFEVVKPKELPTNSGTIIHLENGNFINHGQFQGEQNTQTVTQPIQPAILSKSEPDPANQAAIEEYKRKALKKWKRNGWIWLISSLIITTAAFFLLSLDEIPRISKDAWDKFLKSQTLF